MNLSRGQAVCNINHYKQYKFILIDRIPAESHDVIVSYTKLKVREVQILLG